MRRQYLRNVIVWFAWILCLMVLAGCNLSLRAGQQRSVTTLPPTTAIPSPTEALIASVETPTPTGSPTTVPSTTATPSSTPSPSATNTPRPTPVPPTPTPTAPRTGTPRVKTYVVQPGDTLTGIAIQHGVSMQALVEANNITNPDVVWAGVTLVIPEAGGDVFGLATPLVVVSTARPSSAATVTAQAAATPLAPPPIAATPTVGAQGGTITLPPTVHLNPMTHDWQRLNNCAPVTVAMVLSYYGTTTTQAALAPILKGSNLDRNVRIDEIADYLQSVGLSAPVRFNGNIELMRRFVANGIPVIVEQWLERPDDALTGHFRLVRGYDDSAGALIVNDSYLGANLRFSYAEFDRMWRAFNRAYTPIYRPEQESLVREIVGEDWGDDAMYQSSLDMAQSEIEEKNDLYAWFNQGDSYLGLGQTKEAIAAYERALAFTLPPRFLWYRYGPLEAYNRAGEYQQAIDLAARVLAAVPNLEEAHYYQGVAYEGLNRRDEAVRAYQKAAQYNPNFTLARQALERLQAG
ncbi:MAG: tetratricopeptide repeat protein [Anaerolineae bacterium]|nr:tetratricopeptide repeat protein [Anaerolineae bacterium]